MVGGLEGRWVVVGAVVALLAMPCACGGDDGDDGGADGAGLDAEDVAAFEGIYEITSWTEDDGGCGGAGTDVLPMATDRHFALVGDELFGIRLLELVSCVDVADCEAKVDALRSDMPYAVMLRATLSETLAEDELWGFLGTTGVQMDGVCTMRDYEDHVLTRMGESVTLTTVFKALDDRPPEDGACVADGRALQQEAADAPCVGQRILSGMRIAEL